MYLQQLYPPVENRETGTGSYTFGAELHMAVTGDVSPETLAHLQTLFSQFTCSGGKLLWKHFSGAKAVTAMTSEDICLTGEGEEDGSYSIAVNEDGIRISARDAATFIHAFYTFLQLIIPENLEEGKERFSVLYTKIHDKPALGMRMIHLCVFPETTFQLLIKAIRLAGFLKFTHVILEFWGTFPYQCLPELHWHGKAYTMEQVKSLIQEIRRFGMEPVPMLNHLGHASQCRASVGRHVVLDQAPRYAKLFEPDGWTWCISNPDTLRLLAQMRSELLEVFGPGEFFHLGIDEAYSFASCPACRMAASDKAAFLADYINDLAAQLQSIGRRAIIWHDELVDGETFRDKLQPSELLVPAYPHIHKTEGAIDLLNKDILIADWQYWIYESGSPTSAYFMEHGYNVLLCPWDDPKNIRNMCSAGKKLGADGVIFTTWNTLEDCLSLIPLAGSLMWAPDEAQSRQSGGEVFRTESAAILRRLIPDMQGYDARGWYPYEINIRYLK